jgi:hypothetical protein
MANSIRKVDYFAMQVSHKAGEAARILAALHRDGVNLLAFTGFPDGRGAQLDFVPAHAAKFLRAAKRAKFKLRAKKRGFLVHGADRPGAIAQVLAKLAKIRINVTAVDAVSAGKGRFGAILWVKPKDYNRTAKSLGAR